LRVFQRVLRLFFPTLRTVDITRMMDLDWAVRNADRHDLAALCAICHRAAITQSSVHGQSKACVARHLMHMLDRIPARLGDETGALAQTIEDWRRGNPDAVDCVMQLI
jgi:hypothetical protein